MSDMICKYMAHMGNDILVLDAARVSFGKETDYIHATAARGNLAQLDEFNLDFKDKMYRNYLVDKLPDDPEVDGGSFLKRADFRLLHFLAEHEHVLPFRHPKVTLRCKVPLFVARQLGKHQVGMDWSEESRRYVTGTPEFYWPDKWRKAADNVKQGSSDEEFDIYSVTQGIYPDAEIHAGDFMIIGVELYNKLLEAGCAPEHARMILPQNMMVNFVWTGSLLAWFHLYRMRTDPTSQKETKQFVETVGGHMKKLYPVSWDALTTWRM